jgi:hypothetical protein
MRRFVLSPWGGTDAGWPPGEGARPRRAFLARTGKRQKRGYPAYALRLLGEIVAQREPPENEPAETFYRQVLPLADELGMRPLLAHCHLGLGTRYATLGHDDMARTALAAAIELFRVMDMTVWLPQAEAALAKVEGQ